MLSSDISYAFQNVVCWRVASVSRYWCIPVQGIYPETLIELVCGPASLDTTVHWSCLRVSECLCQHVKRMTTGGDARIVCSGQKCALATSGVWPRREDCLRWKWHSDGAMFGSGVRPAADCNCRWASLLML